MLNGRSRNMNDRSRNMLNGHQLGNVEGLGNPTAVASVMAAIEAMRKLSSWERSPQFFEGAAAELVRLSDPPPLPTTSAAVAEIEQFLVLHLLKPSG